MKTDLVYKGKITVCFDFALHAAENIGLLAVWLLCIYKCLFVCFLKFYRTDMFLDERFLTGGMFQIWL